MRRTEDNDFGNIRQAQAFKGPCKQGDAEHGKQTLGANPANPLIQADRRGKRLTRGLSTQRTSNRLLNESAKMTACSGSCSALSRSWLTAAADFWSCFDPFFGGMTRIGFGTPDEPYRSRCMFPCDEFDCSNDESSQLTNRAAGRAIENGARRFLPRRIQILSGKS